MESIVRQSRMLRIKQTPAERIMWQKLRNRKLQGLKFKRQQKIGNFIVDFYCDELGLIIELDGDVHGYKDKMERDRIRENFLKNRGFKIIRYANSEIYNNLARVMDDLFLRCEILRNEQ